MNRSRFARKRGISPGSRWLTPRAEERWQEARLRIQPRNFEARYFSSQMGRMTSPDPGNAGADPSNLQSWNMYSYVMNNPLRLTDPTGMDPDNGCSSAYDYFTNPECGGIIDTRISNSTMPPLISQRWHFQTPPCSDNDGFVSGWNGHNAER
ncbi:MAG TPA: RHS repeat-associated core domain-containing protein [Candidatus Acidoferrales bacterium]|nr:RHS repeat-associated core domain-containing protein [Candidatus Acidoferrales bacterium]